LIVLGLLTMGVFVLVLAAVHNTAGASVGMLGIGVGVIFVFVSAQTLMQGQTPMEMMGRVSSSLMAALSWAQLLGWASRFGGASGGRQDVVLCERGAAGVVRLCRVFPFTTSCDGKS
jgi:hypothetical protein